MEDLILDDTITPKENNLQNAEFAGFWIRVLAAILDFLILIPIYLLGIYNSLNMKSMALMLFFTLLGAIYKPLLEWKKSASYGKMALNIKVVDSSLNNISGEQALIRYFPWIISLVLSTILNIILYTSIDFENITDFMEVGALSQESALSTLNSIYAFVFIFLIGSLIFDPRKQGVHDKAAKTYCIKKK